MNKVGKSLSQQVKSVTVSLASWGSTPFIGGNEVRKILDSVETASLITRISEIQLKRSADNKRKSFIAKNGPASADANLIREKLSSESGMLLVRRIAEIRAKFKKNKLMRVPIGLDEEQRKLVEDFALALSRGPRFMTKFIGQVLEPDQVCRLRARIPSEIEEMQKAKRRESAGRRYEQMSPEDQRIHRAQRAEQARNWRHNMPLEEQAAHRAREAERLRQWRKRKADMSNNESCSRGMINKAEASATLSNLPSHLKAEPSYAQRTQLPPDSALLQPIRLERKSSIDRASVLAREAERARSRRRNMSAEERAEHRIKEAERVRNWRKQKSKDAQPERTAEVLATKPSKPDAPSNG